MWTVDTLMSESHEVVVLGDDLPAGREKLIWNTGMSPPR